MVPANPGANALSRSYGEKLRINGGGDVRALVCPRVAAGLARGCAVRVAGWRGGSSFLAAVLPGPAYLGVGREYGDLGVSR